MQRIRIKYTKEEQLKFVGHLDFIKVYEKAFRRTELPLTYSQGFNPRMKISWGPPLPLGITSDCELADLYFEGWVRPEQVREEINKVLPLGSKVTEASLCHPALTSVAAAIVASEYIFEFDKSANLADKIKEIMSQEKIIINRTAKTPKNAKAPKMKKGETKELNARAMIFRLEQIEGKLKAVIQSSNTGSLKPSELLKLLGNPSVLESARTKVLIDAELKSVIK